MPQSLPWETLYPDGSLGGPRPALPSSGRELPLKAGPTARARGHPTDRGKGEPGGNGRSILLHLPLSPGRPLPPPFEPLPPLQAGPAITRKRGAAQRRPSFRVRTSGLLSAFFSLPQSSADASLVGAKVWRCGVLRARRAYITSARHAGAPPRASAVTVFPRLGASRALQSGVLLVPCP